MLLSGVQGITDLITTPGLINLDFADVKSVMSGAGSALMGIGSARGENRARSAAETAIASPLLEASMDGAHGVLLSIAGGSDLGLFEINDAASLVTDAAHPDANIIFGAVIDDTLGDEVRVTVIAAGFDSGQLPYKKVDVRKPHADGEPRQCPSRRGTATAGPPGWPLPPSGIGRSPRRAGRRTRRARLPQELTDGSGDEAAPNRTGETSCSLALEQFAGAHRGGLHVRRPRSCRASRLIAVTKGFPRSDVELLAELGLTISARAAIRKRDARYPAPDALARGPPTAVAFRRAAAAEQVPLGGELRRGRAFR